MILLGISGKRRTGKTMLANFLARYYGYVHYSLAEALKDEVRREYGLTREQTDGDLKEVHIERLQASPREIMIEHGRKKREESPSYWIDIVRTKILETPQASVRSFVISDIRFRNEAKWIKRHDGFLVRLERSEDLTGPYIDSPSEKDLDDYPDFDLVVPASHNVDPMDIAEIAQKIHRNITFWQGLHA